MGAGQADKNGLVRFEKGGMTIDLWRIWFTSYFSNINTELLPQFFP
jgi:hypothetical protein